MQCSIKLVVLSAALAWAGMFSPAFAALGQPASSVGADGAAQLAASARLFAMSASGAKTVVSKQVVKTPAGVTIAEYSAGGAVFAVTWAGAVSPDLRQLLATYFPQVQQYVASNPPPFGAPLSMNQGGLVVQTYGHMGALGGSAYLQSQVPAGFDISQIGG